jgi:ATP-dependent exoDNAse (exonuclease V) beta subunit
MQSIYRFRKADVGLFLRVAERGIGQLALTRLQLARNNRSCPAVVDWVNVAFVQVFPAEDDVVRGAIRYREFVATRDTQPQAGVEVHAVIAADGADALEAQRILEIIRHEQSVDPARKIAVLVRARTHLQALVAEIRRHPDGLRFQAVEIEGLSARQPVQDLLALIRAMHHRADRVYWLAVLRAPWCGLMLADLHTLAAGDHQSTIWALMNDASHIARISADGQRRVLHVREVLAEAFAHQGRQPVRRWVESTWLRLGGAGCLAGSADAEDVQALLDLMERLDGAGRFTPEQLETEMERLYAAPDAAGEMLQFMTIHKSKGLEFDTVILPGLHRKPRAGDQPLLLWEEVALENAEETLVAAPLNRRGKSDGSPTAYDYLHSLEKERAGNEAARVLYVAATRAVRKLHLVAVACPDDKGELKPPAGTFLELLWGKVEKDFADAARQAGEQYVAKGDEADFVSRLVRVCDPAVPALMNAVPATPAPLAFVEAGLATGEHDPLAASLGSLAHLYLEMMARDGIELWPVHRVRELQPAMTAWLVQQGHVSAAAQQGAVQLTEALAATLESESGRWVLRSRPNASAELALSSSDADGSIATHVVDRTFVEDGVRWVIDYKSAHLGDAISEDALERQAEFYRPQLERYAGLFAEEGLPVRKGVFFMAHGRLVELPSWKEG